MFGPRPSFVRLTLEAALRDASARLEQDRANAMHALASATLEALAADAAAEDTTQAAAPPAWAALDRHPQGPEIRQRLLTGLEDPSPQIRGLALLALGRLASPETLELARARLNAGDEGPAESFVRECALISLSHLGEAADGPAPDLHAQVRDTLRAALGSERPELRFQAADALARVGGIAEAPRLGAALAAEAHPEVREQLVACLRELDAHDPETLAQVRALVDRATGSDPEIGEGEAFEGARLLAGAGDPAGLELLRAALDHGERRDDAIEALAALPVDRLDDAIVARLLRLYRAWRTPAVTRVRAAYCVARARPAEGLPLLDRLEARGRPAVREAVRDARVALARLEARD